MKNKIIDIKSNYYEIDKNNLLKWFSFNTIRTKLLLINPIPWEYGNLTVLELEIIIFLVLKYKINNIFEFGTFNGRTTSYLAKSIPKEGRVFTLDLPNYLCKNPNNLIYPIDRKDKIFINPSSLGKKIVGKGLKKKIVQIYCDSALLDYKEFKRKFDLVFVDAGHSYDYIKNDTLIAQEITKDIIIWHDYKNIFTGVNKFLNEFIKLNQQFTFYYVKNTFLLIAIRNHSSKRILLE